MKKMISTVVTTGLIWTVTANAGVAMSYRGDIGRGHGSGRGYGNGGVASVPEIDAASGLLALAAVAALVALFYELRRRRIHG